MNFFDICVVTTGSKHQAATIRSLINRRIDHGLYPREIAFHVFSDPDRSAIGSAGATVLALDELRRILPGRHSLDSKKILVVNAGGANNALPCYAPECKLFVPLPVDSSSILPPVAFDCQLTLFLKYPWRAGEILVASGDVILDFDATSVPADRGDICGFAVPASLEQASRHGVFHFDAAQQSIVDYFQKQPIAFLKEHARIEGTGECAVDAGLLSVSTRFVQTILDAGRGKNGLLERLSKGAVGFDWYLDVMTACCRGMAFDEYSRRLKGRSRLDPADQATLFSAMREFTIRAALVEHAAFVHVGRLDSFVESCAELRRSKVTPFYGQPGDEIRAYATENLIGFNNDGVEIPIHRAKTVLVEGSRACTLENLVGGNLIAGCCNVHYASAVPEHLCIDERHLGQATLRCVYGVRDTFAAGTSVEQQIYCGMPMTRWLEERGLVAGDLWDAQSSRDLLDARLFCDSSDDEYLAGFWSVGAASPEWVATFRRSARRSLNEINALDDAVARDKARMTNRTAMLAARIASKQGWRLTGLEDLKLAAAHSPAANQLEEIVSSTDDIPLAAFRRAQLMLLRPDADTGALASMTTSPLYSLRPLALSRKKPVAASVTATAPLRIDLAGGWSDTPPFTLRHDGAVVSIAVDLGGKPPVEVTVRRISQPVIVVRAKGGRTVDVITDFAMIADSVSAVPPYGMVRALLAASGFSAEESGVSSLEKLLRKIGGFEMTLKTAVASGAGLGASSILCAAAVASLARYFGVSLDLQSTTTAVMRVERMMGGGSGWQDIIGCCAGGAIYATCKAGVVPLPSVFHLDPFLFSAPDRAALFTLYDTGISRACTTMVEDVVATMYANAPATLFTLQRIEELARECRDAIGMRDVTHIGAILSDSFKANSLLHPATSTRAVQAVFKKAGASAVGAKLVGAGGGGFAFFVSPDAESAKKLRSKVASGNGKVVRWSLNTQGMTISAR